MDAANTLALQQTFERRQLPDSLTRAIMRLAAACTTAEQTIVLTRILNGLPRFHPLLCPTDIRLHSRAQD